MLEDPKGEGSAGGRATVRAVVRLYSTFRDYGLRKEGSAVLELEAPAKVESVLRALEIPADVPKVILLNGRPVWAEQALEAGDELAIFPPVEGG